MSRTVKGGLWSRRRITDALRDFSRFIGASMFATQVLWVHSSGGTSAALGGRPDQPLSTLAGAVALATTVTGFVRTVIYVLPGHAETVTSVAIATDRVRIIGMGVDRARPIFTLAATDSQFVLTGDYMSFDNIVFDFTGIDAVVAGILADGADGLTFTNCEFITNGAAAGCVSGITIGATTACNRWRIENCRFLGPAVNSGTTTTAQVTYTAGVDFIFRGNYCTGKMTQSITNAAAVLRGQIHDNVFVVATGTKAINCHASSTPMITSNRINVPSGTAPIVAAAGFVAGNVYSAAAGVTAGTASTI